MSEPVQESKVEVVKRASHHLRGTLAETLANEAPAFETDDSHLLKFHGTYQEDDRDKRAEARKTGAGKTWIFMVRVKLPGGRLTSQQYLALDQIAERGQGMMRITTRQGLQFHHIVKGDLKSVIADVNKALMTTFGACGDVSRNVMCCPAPIATPGREKARGLASLISDALLPATHAYYEIWLDGEKVQEGPGPVEPFYGDVYLPRKFKIGIAIAPDNCIDVYTHDLGFIALLSPDEKQFLGSNVLVGGGFGMSHGKPETFARIATPLGFVGPDHLIETSKIICAIFRDLGNRSDRAQARIKYVVEKLGIEKIREEFRSRADFELQPWREIPPMDYQDHLGPHPQGDGRFFYGVYIPAGRIADTPKVNYRTAFLEIVRRLSPDIAFTPAEKILFANLAPQGIGELESILDHHGIPRVQELSPLRRNHQVCVSLPTCGLALAESERAMPAIIDEFEAEFRAQGVNDVPLTLRCTGCPNGCARPYCADISFVGRAAEIYDIYVGGTLRGDRLGDLYAEKIRRPMLLSTLKPLIESYRQERLPTEAFGDFYQRVYGEVEHRTLLTGDKSNPRLKQGALLPPRRIP